MTTEALDVLGGRDHVGTCSSGRAGQDRRRRLPAFLRDRRRAGAGDRPCRPDDPRGRVRDAGRAQRLRQDHAAQGARRLHPADRRHHPVRRQAGARAGPRARRGVPGAGDPAVADGAPQHRAWARDCARAARRARGDGQAPDRADRAHRLRGPLSARAVGRHAPARGGGAHVGRRSRRHSDGRAVRGGRRHDAADAAGRAGAAVRGNSQDRVLHHAQRG